jgi:hypothetical protein
VAQRAQCACGLPRPKPIEALSLVALSSIAELAHGGGAQQRAPLGAARACGLQRGVAGSSPAGVGLEVQKHRRLHNTTMHKLGNISRIGSRQTRVAVLTDIQGSAVAVVGGEVRRRFEKTCMARMTSGSHHNMRRSTRRCRHGSL